MYVNVISADVYSYIELITFDIIHSVVRVSALTWFIIYIYHWSLEFVNNTIII